MKITAKTDRLWVGTCSNCESHVEAATHELVNIKGDDIKIYTPGKVVQYEMLKCPVCNARMVFRLKET